MVSPSKRFAVSIALAASFLSKSEGSPTIIDDDRVRNVDVVPVLGRGYSVQTDSYQSICLNITDTTTPSYNYWFDFTDFTQVEDVEVGGTDPDNPTSIHDLANKIKSSFGHHGVVSKLNLKRKRTGKTSTKLHIISATMRVERIYSSVQEHVSPLVDDAKTLLERRDYIGFFKACGPNYIRSIRRAQEVTAIFTFQSTSKDIASEFTADLKMKGNDGWNWKVKLKSKQKYNSLMNSLQIDINAWGLGLDHKGSGSLVATTLEEYDSVMGFAFKAMTENSAYDIGMVYGMEVVPWTDNVNFQVASGIQGDYGASIATVRSGNLDKAKDGSTDFVVGQDRANYSCESSLKMDDLGYCCEERFLYDSYTQQYATAPVNEPELYRCRVPDNLDKTLAKDTMIKNAEFISDLDRIVRHKSNQISTLGRCISAARSLPTKFNYYLLQPQESVEYDFTLARSFTLLELKRAVDPKGDYGMITHLGRELDEFMDMFYQPCLSAMYGKSVYENDFGGVEPGYIMAHEYHTHSECSHLACLTEGMRWNRNNTGGCVASLIAGTSAADYAGSTDGPQCSKTPGTTTCKYSETILDTYRDNAVTCWGTAIPSGDIGHIIEQFCMPKLTGYKVSSSRQTTLSDVTVCE